MSPLNTRSLRRPPAPRRPTPQIWDSIQAICSYVRSSFTTKALLEVRPSCRRGVDATSEASIHLCALTEKKKTLTAALASPPRPRQGIGVGNNAATALGATTQFFARDLTGRVGSIAFALAQGNRLDASAKQWRLFADCCNNVAYLLELAAPVFPAFFVPLLCLARCGPCTVAGSRLAPQSGLQARYAELPAPPNRSLGHALTGIAGGATRAALTQHFARASNAADVAAKEGSQETLTTLVGMFLGMWALHVVGDNAEAMWCGRRVLAAAGEPAA